MLNGGPVSCLVSKQQGLPANSSTDAMCFYRYFFSKYEIKCEIDVTFNKYVCLTADGDVDCYWTWSTLNHFISYLQKIMQC